MAQPSSWRDPPEYSEPESRGGMPRMTRAVRMLLLANVAVFAVSFLTWFFGKMTGTGAWAIVAEHLVLQPDDWRHFFFGLPVWQLVTSGFLHDVETPMHILMNMLVLYFFGTMLESLVGTLRFTLTYFAAMFTGALLFLGVGIVAGAVTGHPQTPALGASGACLGILVAMAMLRPHAPIVFIVVPMTLRTLALIFVGFDIFGLLVEIATKASDGTAHVIHLGGALYGFVAVKSGLIWRDPVEAVERRRAVKEVERAASDEQRMDEILAKIHREGMSALTKGEREFLKRVSARR